LEIKALDGHYLIRLEPGDEIIECLKRFADEHKIGFAALSGIGTFRSRWATSTPPPTSTATGRWRSRWRC